MSQVYSYLRFSSARQGTGSSIDRQLEYARRWASENGMVLDESLTMRDEGLSAYHQRHVKAGALGVFLVAAQEGRPPPRPGRNCSAASRQWITGRVSRRGGCSPRLSSGS